MSQLLEFFLHGVVDVTANGVAVEIVVKDRSATAGNARQRFESDDERKRRRRGGGRGSKRRTHRVRCATPAEAAAMARRLKNALLQYMMYGDAKGLKWPNEDGTEWGVYNHTCMHARI
jgi:hypothetical protein